MDKRTIKKQFCIKKHDTFIFGRNKWKTCKVCESQRHLDPIRQETARFRRSEIKNTIRKILNQLKRKPCMDCNGSFNPWQMDFDHRPEEKKIFEINKFVNVSSITTFKLKQLYQEIAKCDLVCANCHRDRTHYRIIQKTI